MTTPIKPPADNLPRVFRGGAWDDLDADWVRASYRGRYAPAYRNLNRGFRCALRGREPRDPSKVGL